MSAAYSHQGILHDPSPSLDELQRLSRSGPSALRGLAAIQVNIRKLRDSSEAMNRDNRRALDERVKSERPRLLGETVLSAPLGRSDSGLGGSLKTYKDLSSRMNDLQEAKIEELKLKKKAGERIEQLASQVRALAQG
jgi:hypothetical protein